MSDEIKDIFDNQGNKIGEIRPHSPPVWRPETWLEKLGRILQVIFTTMFLIFAFLVVFSLIWPPTKG